MRISRHLLALVAVLFVCSLGTSIFLAILAFGNLVLKIPLAPGESGSLPAVETGALPATSTPGLADRPSATTLPATAVPAMPAATPSAAHTETPAPTFTPTAPVDQSSENLAVVNALLAQMTLEEKVGQMIVGAIGGTSLTGTDRSLLAELHLGGIVYFARNAVDPEQTRQLSSDLQDAALEGRLPIPLWIAIDHEGGRVYRFREGMTRFPSAMALGAAGSPDLVFQVAAASASELGYTGVNLDLGPVLDVNADPLNEVISLRSFGSSPESVALLGESYRAGLLSQGMMAVGKHFPGHGSTAIDSHTALPTIQKSLDEMLRSDLLPFAAFIRNDAGALMVGHLANPQIDATGRPATLSPVFVQQILREQLGFQGVVVTDAMSMGAIVNQYGLGEAAVLAVAAGCDLLAFARVGEASIGYEAVLAAVQNQRIPIEQIDASVRRLLLLKQQARLFEDSSLVNAAQPPDFQAHQALAMQAARQAITYQGDLQAPILNGETLLIVSPDKLPSGSAAGDNLTLLGEKLAERGYNLEEWVYSPANLAAQAATLSQAAERIGEYQKVLFVMHDALLNRERFGDTAQVDWIETASQAGTPVIVIAANSPYDLSLLAENQAALAIFGELDVQIEALVEALLSGELPGGQMPVDLSFSLR